MKFTVIGPVPIATSKGDVDPGGTLDAEDLDERTNLLALVKAGHLELLDEKKAAASGQKPADK